MDEKNALSCFNEFVKVISPTTTPKDRLFVVSGIIELLRRVDGTHVTLGLAQLLAELPPLRWASIPFSLTQAALGPTYASKLKEAGVPDDKIPDAMLQSVLIFLDFFQGGAEIGEDVFAAIVESVGVDLARVRVKNTVAPELFKNSFVSRAFVPDSVNEKTFKSLEADVVLYRGELLGGKLGPDIRGVAFDNGTKTSHILLETGEFVRTPLKALAVAGVTEPADFENVPAVLLASLTVAAGDLFVAAIIDKARETALQSGCLGHVSSPHHKVVVTADSLRPLEYVFESGRDASCFGTTGPNGATVRFPVAGTDMVVVIDARLGSDSAPYCVSRLVRCSPGEDDVVIMRNDTPRLFTSRGVYIFPTKNDGLVSLTAIY